MKKLISHKLYKSIIKNKTNCIFVSPHLDDAIFSAGGLISDLRTKNIKVTIVNIFTKPSPKPYTISVKKFLKACGYTNADKLFKDRILEDRKAAKKIGARVVNLDYVDALWRRKQSPLFSSFLSRIIPELDYVYPIFRFAISKGRVSKEDDKLKKNLELKLTKVIGNKGIVFCPIAIGKHVDHIITREVCDNIFDTKIYWADYPYSDFGEANKKYLEKNKLKRYNHKINSKGKNSLVNMYNTQIFAIFGKKSIEVPDTERFYL